MTTLVHGLRRQRGATLIESLVSLIILAIAIIGMLGVQVRTLMDTNTAASRSQAMLLIEDLGERIRANPGGYGVLDQYVFNDGTTPATVDCTSAWCDAADLAKYDVGQWLNTFKSTMPGAKVVTFISDDNNATTGNRQLGVVLGWMMRERNDNITSDHTQPFTIDADTVKGGVSDLGSGKGCWDNYICHLVYIEP